MQLHFLPRVLVKEILEGFAAAAPRRGSHISRSKSTMGFEAGQRMRAISVYSGRIVIYNGGEADVRLRGMNVPVAGYKSTVSLWQRSRSSRISCATRVIPAGKRLGYVRASNPALSIPPLRSAHISATRNALRSGAACVRAVLRDDLMHRCVADVLRWLLSRLCENLTKVSAGSYGSPLKAEFRIKPLTKRNTL